MSNTKHTPGPWFITEGSTYGYTTTLKVEAGASDDRKFGMVICERQAPSYNTGIRAECDANSRLIAAAPELLDICESILAEVDYEGLNLESGRVAKLRAAIAKATAQ